MNACVPTAVQGTSTSSGSKGRSSGNLDYSSPDGSVSSDTISARTEFINLAYRSFLNRAPTTTTTGELANWLDWFARQSQLGILTVDAQFAMANVLMSYPEFVSGTNSTSLHDPSKFVQRTTAVVLARQLPQANIDVLATSVGAYNSGSNRWVEFFVSAYYNNSRQSLTDGNIPGVRVPDSVVPYRAQTDHEFVRSIYNLLLSGADNPSVDLPNSSGIYASDTISDAQYLHYDIRMRQLVSDAGLSLEAARKMVFLGAFRSSFTTDLTANTARMESDYDNDITNNLNGRYVTDSRNFNSAGGSDAALTFMRRIYAWFYGVTTSSEITTESQKIQTFTGLDTTSTAPVLGDATFGSGATGNVDWYSYYESALLSSKFVINKSSSNTCATTRYDYGAAVSSTAPLLGDMFANTADFPTSSKATVNVTPVTFTPADADANSNPNGITWSAQKAAMGNKVSIINFTDYTVSGPISKTVGFATILDGNGHPNIGLFNVVTTASGGNVVGDLIGTNFKGGRTALFADVAEFGASANQDEFYNPQVAVNSTVCPTQYVMVMGCRFGAPATTDPRFTRDHVSNDSLCFSVSSSPLEERSWSRPRLIADIGAGTPAQTTVSKILGGAAIVNPNQGSYGFAWSQIKSGATTIDSRAKAVDAFSIETPTLNPALVTDADIMMLSPSGLSDYYQSAALISDVKQEGGYFYSVFAAQNFDNGSVDSGGTSISFARSAASVGYYGGEVLASTQIISPADGSEVINPTVAWINGELYLYASQFTSGAIGSGSFVRWKLTKK